MKKKNYGSFCHPRVRGNTTTIDLKSQRERTLTLLQNYLTNVYVVYEMTRST